MPSLLKAAQLSQLTLEEASKQTDNINAQPWKEISEAPDTRQNL